jgi:hypothetical protein
MKGNLFGWFLFFSACTCKTKIDWIAPN